MLNSERALVRIVREIAVEQGMGYASFSYDWVLRLTKNGIARHIHGYKFPLNDAVAHAICTDKAAASFVLAEAGVPNVCHRFFAKPTLEKYVGEHSHWPELMEMLSAEKELVCKPNDGTGGNHVFRVGSLPALESAVFRIFSAYRGMAVCKFHTVHTEHRVILLDGQALAVYQKMLPFVTGDGRSPVSVLTALKYPGFEEPPENADYIPAGGETVTVGWKHNLDKSSFPVLTEPGSPFAKKLEGLASRAATACGVRFASVDIINAEGPQPMVLEVNSGVMMENFAAVDERFYGIAKEVYRRAVAAMFD
jgi:glutathione synthase/RimK-type ligase-like ATP-grasp enzyme